MRDSREKKFQDKRDKAMDNFKEFWYQELAATNIQTLFNGELSNAFGQTERYHFYTGVPDRGHYRGIQCLILLNEGGTHAKLKPIEGIYEWKTAYFN